MSAEDIILLDADIVAFKLAAKAQRSYQWADIANPSIALDDFSTLPARIDEAVNDICKVVKTDKVIVCLSCPTAENWRLKVLPTYKGNRKDTVRPEHLAAVKDYMEAEYPSYRKPLLEADDIMGILSTMKGLPPNFLAENPGFAKHRKKVIVSEDKDMKTIPGWLYNPGKDTAPRLICEEEAEWFHLWQTVVGDPTDGYTGAPGVGPAKAKGFLGTWEEGRKYITSTEGWRRVLEAYASKKLGEEEALVQARVARICRAIDYDFKQKDVILWTPSRD